MRSACTSTAPSRRRRLVLAALSATLIIAAQARSASAEGERAGDATIISPATLEPITGGDGESAFSIRLPEGAACPGDSVQQQYRVQSFLAPERIDPASLIYKGVRPRAEGAWALYDTSTRTFMNAGTDMASEPGGEGPIVNIPSFSYAVFEPGMIVPGRYHVGIACSLWTETTRYWSTMLEFEVDEDDAAGIAWAVIDPPDGAVDPNGGGIPTVSVALGAAGALAACVAVAIARRRPDRSPVGPGHEVT